MKSSFDASKGDWLNQLLQTREPTYSHGPAERGANASSDSQNRKPRASATNGLPTQPTTTGEVADHGGDMNDAARRNVHALPSPAASHHDTSMRIATRCVFFTLMLVASHAAACAIGYFGYPFMAKTTVPTEQPASTASTNTAQASVAVPAATEPPKPDLRPEKRPSPWTANALPQPVTGSTAHSLLDNDFKRALRPILEKLP
jgi:hypothetical protein